jgi:hypothetical protein
VSPRQSVCVTCHQAAGGWTRLAWALVIPGGRSFPVPMASADADRAKATRRSETSQIGPVSAEASAARPAPGQPLYSRPNHGPRRPPARQRQALQRPSAAETGPAVAAALRRSNRRAHGAKPPDNSRPEVWSYGSRPPSPRSDFSSFGGPAACTGVMQAEFGSDTSAVGRRGRHHGV